MTNLPIPFLDKSIGVKSICLINWKDNLNEIVDEGLIAFNKKLEQSVIEKTVELDTNFYRIIDGFIGLTKNWNFTYENRKATQLLGGEPGSLVGKNVWTEFPENIKHPIYKAFHRAMALQQ